MSKAQFVEKLNDLLELAPGTLKGGESLDSIEAWDSMAVLSFLAMADSDLGVSVPASKVAAAKTLDDLYALVQPAA